MTERYLILEDGSHMLERHLDCLPPQQVKLWPTQR